MWKAQFTAIKALRLKAWLSFFQRDARRFVKTAGVLMLLMGFTLPTKMAGASEASVGEVNVPPKVALVMKALSNPFFAKMKKGAKDYAERKEIELEVFGVERETDIQEQITIVKRLIQQNYPAIVIAPADSKRLIPVLKEALEQNIVVIIIDNALDKKSLQEAGISIPFVGSDNYRGSAMIGEYVRRKLPKGGNVLYVEGIRGNENADLRKSGFHAGLKEGTFTTVGSISANWHADEAMNQVAEFLSESSQTVDVIACANDVMALGALQAINALYDGENRPLITGYDNIPEVHSELFSGGVKATIEQNPDMMGAYGLRLAIQGLQGIPLPEYEPTPLNLISYDTFGKKVLLSVSNQANPFFSTLVEGAKKTAELNGLNIEITDAQNDHARQLEQISTSLENNIDLAIINPTDSVTIGPGIELINSEDIPVITVDRQSIDGVIATHIASDNSQGGRMAAEFISDKLPGGGKILEIQGILGTSAAHERGKGFNDYFKNKSNIVIERITADFDAEKSQNIMTEMLKSGRHYDAIFAHNDEMIFGAMKALQQFHWAELSSDSRKMPLDEPMLVGFDAIDKVVDAVNRGDISATVAQNPGLMGSMAIIVAADIIRNMTVQPEIKVDLKLIKYGTQQF